MSDCARSRQVRVLVVPIEQLLPMLRGTARCRNLPKDAQVVAALPIGNRVGVRVHSASYSPVEVGLPIPTVTAVFDVPEREHG